MWKRRLKVMVALAVAGGLAWAVFHHRPSERALIEELVAKAVHGVETRSADEIMSCVAPDYHDDLGLSETDVWRAAHHWARTVTEAEVVIEDYALEIEPPRATGSFDVRVAFTQDGQHRELDPMHLTVQFEKERRRWRRVWLVKSVTGPELARLFEDYM